MKYSYRITKYDLSGGNSNVASEWTSYSDIRDLEGYREYLVTEGAYIDAVVELCRCFNVNALTIRGLELKTAIDNFQEGQSIDVLGIDSFIRMILREKLWCKLVSEKCEFHFGYDYYMYMVSN